MIAFLFGVAAAIPTADLDGDGIEESILVDGHTVRLGGSQVTCGHGRACQVSLIDLDRSRPGVEAVLCETSDEAIRCRIYTLVDGSAVIVPFDDGSSPEEVSVDETGLVHARAWADRLYLQTRLYRWTAGTLIQQAQPFFAVGIDLQTVAPLVLTTAPGGGAPITTVAPGRITVVLEDRTHDDWYLVAPGGGVLGWASLGALSVASPGVPAPPS